MRMAFLPVSVQAVRPGRMSPRRECQRLLGAHPVCHTPACPVRCRWHTQHHGLTLKGCRYQLSCMSSSYRIGPNLLVARREGFVPPNRQIRSLVLCVGLVGSRPIWPVHVGCLVDLVGSQTGPVGSSG